MKKPILPLAYTFCLLLLGALLAATPANPGYQVGDTATDFKLKYVDGEMVSMADYKDAMGFIVTFTCNTCPYAIA